MVLYLDRNINLQSDSTRFGRGRQDHSPYLVPLFDVESHIYLVPFAIDFGIAVSTVGPGMPSPVAIHERPHGVSIGPAGDNVQTWERALGMKLTEGGQFQCLDFHLKAALLQVGRDQRSDYGFSSEGRVRRHMSDVSLKGLLQNKLNN